MKRLTLLLLFTVATSSINVFGWELDLDLNAGLRIGMNSSNMRAEKYFDGEPLLGFHVGGFYDWAILDCFYIQPGLSYTTRGSDLTKSGSTNKIKLGYMQLPLLASYRFTIGEKQRFALNCGTTYGYAVSGRHEYETYESNGTKVECSEGLFVDGHDYNRFEVGANMGLSYFIKNHYINFSWERGLTKIYEYEYDGNDCKVFNNNISITVGYTF